MEIPARVEVLKRAGLFAGLAPEAMDDVARQGQERRFAAGDVLFHEGDEATHGFVVGWGRLRLEQTTPDGQTVVLRYMGPGDLLAAVAVLRRIPLPATAVTVEDGLLLAWSAPRLADLMEL